MNLPLNIDVQQILLHIFNFVILAVGLYFLLYKPVKQFMDNRTHDLKVQMAEAKEKLDNAQKQEKKYSDLLSGAETTIQEKLKENDERIAQLYELAKNDAARKAESIIANAHKVEEETKKQTLQEIRESVIDLSLSIASGILEREISAKENEKIILKSLREWSEAHD